MPEWTRHYLKKLIVLALVPCLLADASFASPQPVSFKIAGVSGFATQAVVQPLSARFVGRGVLSHSSLLVLSMTTALEAHNFNDLDGSRMGHQFFAAVFFVAVGVGVYLYLKWCEYKYENSHPFSSREMGTLFGFKTYFSPWAVMALVGYTYIATRSLIWSALNAIFYFGSIWLHEWGHARFYRKFKLTEITIHIKMLSGFARGKMPGKLTASQLVQIAGGGVLLNVLISVVLYGFMNLFDQLQDVVEWAPEASDLCERYLKLNYMMAYINIAPILPLDGGFLLLAALQKTSRDTYKQFRRFMRWQHLGILFLYALDGIIFLSGNAIDGIALLLTHIYLHWNSSTEVREEWLKSREEASA